MDRKSFASGFLGAAVAFLALAVMGPTSIHVPTKRIHPNADTQGTIDSFGYDPADLVENPDLSAIAVVNGHQITRLVPRKYWTTDDAGLTWREMTQPEKDVVDAADEGNYFGSPQVVIDTGRESVRFLGPKGSRILRVRWGNGTTTDIATQ